MNKRKKKRGKALRVFFSNSDGMTQERQVKDPCQLFTTRNYHQKKDKQDGFQQSRHAISNSSLDAIICLGIWHYWHERKTESMFIGKESALNRVE